MRVFILATLLTNVLALQGCSGAEIRVDEKLIKQDLQLQLNIANDASFTPGNHNSYPKVAYALTNNSKTATYPVVLPGDGSECGWREPNISYTAWFRPNADTEWQELSPNAYGRCGNYDANWHDEIVLIKPNTSNTDKRWEWTPVPWYGFRYPSAGTVRFQATYSFNRTEATERNHGQPKGLSKMKGMPAFSLKSNFIEVKVTRATPNEQ